MYKECVKHINPSEFWSLTPRETQLLLEAKSELNYQRQLEDWRRARLIAYYAVAPYLKRKLSLEEFLPLGERRERRPPEDLKKSLEFLKKFEKTKPVREVEGKEAAKVLMSLIHGQS